MKIRQLLIVLSLELTLVVGFFVLVGRAAPSSPDPDPDPNTHSAPLTTSVSITYDEPISAATVTSRTFAIHAMQTGLVTASPGVNGNTIIVTPGHAFHPSELVQTTATTGTLSVGGEHPISYTVWQFRTAVLAGSGAFTAHPTSPTFGAGNSLGIAVGDVDGDGDLDAIIANQGYEPQDVYLNDGHGAFVPHPTSPTFGGGQSVDVALGDVDGDGDLDAIVANALNEAERVYLNDGSGVFAPHATFPTFGAGYSMSVALGDVDGDGDLDAVVANFLNEPQAVYLNDGSGAFAPHPTSPTFGSGYSRAIALADVDDDGDLDAVVANHNQPQDVYLNDGSGVFTPHPISPTFGGGQSMDVALGDVDGDGDLDAIVANSSQPKDVYLNNGSGVFTPHPISPTFGAGQSSAMALGDIDGDGDLDAILANFDTAQDVYLNDGTGRFVAYPTSFGAGYCMDIVLGDVDSDGDLDVVIAGGFDEAQRVWLNRNRIPGVDPVPNSHHATRDTNLSILSNGDISQATVTTQAWFVHGSFQGHLSGAISLDDGDVLYTPDERLYTGEIVEASVTAGVLSRDGTPVVPYVWQFRAAVEKGNGAFVSHPFSPTLGTSYSLDVALGDVDGDGDLDAVVANHGQAQEVYLNGGNGDFAPHPISPTFGAGNSRSIALGDVDGDGDLDAVVANYGQTQEVYLNDGNGVFASHPSFPSFGGNDSRDIVLGDVDGDGDLDALIGNNNHAQEIYLNDGTGRFTPHPTIPSFGAYWSYAVALGDIDSDGDLDAIVANDYEPQEVFLNDGTGAFTAHPISPSFGTDPNRAIALGDVDGDSDLDAVVAGDNGQPEEVFLNDSSGIFEPHPASPTFGGGHSTDIVLGDIDGDGDLDAIVANYWNEAQDVYLNDGNGIFTSHPISPTFGADWSYAVALGDIDSDGDLDAVVANSSQDDAVWVNGGLADTTPGVYLPMVLKNR